MRSRSSRFVAISNRVPACCCYCCLPSKNKGNRERRKKSYTFQANLEECFHGILAILVIEYTHVGYCFCMFTVFVVSHAYSSVQAHDLLRVLVNEVCLKLSALNLLIWLSTYDCD
jgi:hypothetical protein